MYGQDENKDGMRMEEHPVSSGPAPAETEQAKAETEQALTGNGPVRAAAEPVQTAAEPAAADTAQEPVILAEVYPVNGGQAVQEAMAQRAAQEEEERQRRIAAAEARRLAEENRRLAAEWRAKQQAFQEEQERQKAERREKNRRRAWKAAGVFGIVFGLAALVLTLIGYRNSQNTQKAMASLQAELNTYKQSAASASETTRLPEATSLDTSALVIGKEGSGSTLTDVSDMVEETIRSVVSISIKQKVKVSTGFFGEREYITSGAGSGVIIGDNGTELWIVTNEHVISGATEITVTLADDTTADAYVKGTSSENDIAVLGISLDSMTDETKQAIRTAAIGSSDTLRLGEGVVAIGNALGWGQSVTTGVVSALSRTVEFDDGSTMNLLQISAAINPGNSGGALLNAKGELIGINNAKYTSEEVEGVGFAIPISSIVGVMEELSLMEPRVKVSEEEMPYMGITFQNYPSGYLSFYNVPEGAVISEVQEGSPAETAGLVPYDVITAIDGNRVDGYDSLVEELQYHKGGTDVEITYMRLIKGSYQENTVTMTLGLKSEQNP
ncbi:MAG: trypsin-like peptidase domain-containing protein [Lachnospiraceae bacterium]|nr:trypsin-like peptidase domain-containing protein [Lachnospiraceae bacterium]